MATAQNGARGIRVQVQRFGSFLSGMVMPNIGAFIAWGIITALFIPTGWAPNKELGELVGPTITYLLPLLIGYTGGKLMHDVRGGVVGTLATMGGHRRNRDSDVPWCHDHGTTWRIRHQKV